LPKILYLVEADLRLNPNRQKSWNIVAVTLMVVGMLGQIWALAANSAFHAAEVVLAEQERKS
jgi:hypothetical protein